jgi:NADPH-dependent curcumin reductase CurA
MGEAESYARPLALGELMPGGAVGRVLESADASFAIGGMVQGALGWQDYAVVPGSELRAIDASLAPIQTALGVLGMPGLTAYFGLLDVCHPKAGQTVVVSGAAGAVGQTVGQLAKIKGCRAVGIAGGPDKCRYVTQELGFDACVDYKAGRLRDDLQAAAPKGVDVDFENVGGEVLDAVLPLMNPASRITICGLISQYNATEPYGVKNLRSVLVNRIRMQGFIVSDRMELWPRALEELGRWVAEGKIRYRETVAHGLENAPRAFIGMLRGENLGKQLVKLT